MATEICPVVIDTDPGVDDALALLFALAHPAIRVEAITCVAGNVGLDLTVRNGLRLLNLVGRRDVPLAVGADRPLRRPFEDASYAHGDNGMNGVELPDPAGLAPARLSAPELIIELSKEYPGTLTLCAVGPLTNVALALQSDPGLAQRLGQILVMGGACFTHGNVTAAAEFNIWCDPDAAQIVYNSGARITQVGLDVTHHVLLTPEHVDAVVAGRSDPTSVFLRALTGASFAKARHLGRSAMAMHDPLTVALCAAPDLVATQFMRVDVEVESPLTLGMTLADRRSWRHLRPGALPENVHVAHQVDSDRFFQLYLPTMAQAYREAG